MYKDPKKRASLKINRWILLTILLLLTIAILYPILRKQIKYSDERLQTSVCICSHLNQASDLEVIINDSIFKFHLNSLSIIESTITYRMGINNIRINHNNNSYVINDSFVIRDRLQREMSIIVEKLNENHSIYCSFNENKLAGSVNDNIYKAISNHDSLIRIKVTIFNPPILE